MGREVEGTLQFRGQSGPGKLLLEGEALLLRGAVRGRVARDSISGESVQAGVLTLQTPDGPLVADLGPAALAFARALAKQPPDLATKLGIGPDKPVLVLTPLTDAALIAATGPWTCDAPRAALTLAELADASVLEALLPDLPPLPFWGVTVKGKAASFSDAELRSRMRAAGWIDSKSCAVSNRMTATRYGPRAAAPGQV